MSRWQSEEIAHSRSVGSLPRQTSLAQRPGVNRQSCRTRWRTYKGTTRRRSRACLAVCKHRSVISICCPSTSNGISVRIALSPTHFRLAGNHYSTLFSLKMRITRGAPQLTISSFPSGESLNPIAALILSCTTISPIRSPVMVSQTRMEVPTSA
jgi:hypothetical protein